MQNNLHNAQNDFSVLSKDFNIIQTSDFVRERDVLIAQNNLRNGQIRRHNADIQSIRCKNKNLLDK